MSSTEESQKNHKGQTIILARLLSSSSPFTLSIPKNLAPSPNSPPTPQAPPAGLCTSPPPPLLACRLVWRVGGPPLHLLLLHHTPPPVLVSLHSNTSHFRPSVHENRSIEVADVHALPHLAVQAVHVHAIDAHDILHLPPWWCTVWDQSNDMFWSLLARLSRCSSPLVNTSKAKNFDF